GRSGGFRAAPRPPPLDPGVRPPGASPLPAPVARAHAALGGGGPSPRRQAVRRAEDAGFGRRLQLGRLLPRPLPSRRERGLHRPPRGGGPPPGGSGQPALPPRLRRPGREGPPRRAAPQGPRGRAFQAGHRPVRAPVRTRARGRLGRPPPGLPPGGRLPALAGATPRRAAWPLPFLEFPPARLPHPPSLPPPP